MEILDGFTREIESTMVRGSRVRLATWREVARLAQAAGEKSSQAEREAAQLKFVVDHLVELRVNGQSVAKTAEQVEALPWAEFFALMQAIQAFEAAEKNSLPG